MRSLLPSATRLALPILLPFALITWRASAQTPVRAPLRSIADRTAGLERLDGFLPLYWDSAGGQLLMEIPRLDTQLLYVTGLGSGLGSNDIGLDRGILQGSRIVFFERQGPRVMMVQPNLQFRSSSTDAAERRTVRDAFARSVLWGFTVAAEADGGRRVLVDVTDFLLRDANNMAGRLTPGSYRFDNTRSSIYRPMTMNFPKNTEMEAELTFVSQPGAAAGGRGGAFFEGVGSVAATADAASIRVHHSFVELPDDNYRPRLYDPRSGFGATSYEDYSAPLGQPMTVRYARRHRLEKRDPTAAVSDPVKPIIYYLDPGTPEPVRTALLEGARWWNQAFEAAGYRNAFRVELLPEGVSTHDIRYNVINWVHRSTRGWSTGASVTDPRTGEIIKGVVTLGSLRVRQDWMIFEGLLQPYGAGDAENPEVRRWALQRLRQLAAHEVGHTLGIGHNYYNSTAGRISVMDYPHPLATLRPDGSIDLSQAYTNEIGAWDRVAVTWAYSHFPQGTDERQALQRVLEGGWQRDLFYLSNQDLGLTPQVDQWAHGTDAAAELDRVMTLRRTALSRFGTNALRTGVPLATLEETLVPLYLHHRYQVESAVSAIGGVRYGYALKGDATPPPTRVPAGEQRAVLRSLMAVLSPRELALPSAVLASIPPRPPGWGRTRELFPRYTGSSFDAITPAVVAAEHVIATLLSPDRAARLVQQKALDAALPSLEDVLQAVHNATFGAMARNPYEAEIKRSTERILVEQLITLASSAPMPQVRAVASLRLERLRADASTRPGTEPDVAHLRLLATDIKRFLERPEQPVTTVTPGPDIPPGAPIGEPALDWLRRVEPPCSWWR